MGDEMKICYSKGNWKHHLITDKINEKEMTIDEVCIYVYTIPTFIIVRKLVILRGK